MHENPEVARILEAFYAVLDEGGEADADATCRAHPEHAEALRAHFTALALLDEALGVLPAEEGEDRLGEYRLGAELGSGGMGTVYFARCEGRTAGLEPGDPVALKVVHPHLLEAAGFFKRFLREAEVGKAVRHPNVVRTYDADAILARGIYHHFLVMEYVEGQTLRALLGELGPLPEELCLHVAGEIAKGLTAIHAAGVVHRDIKPENVLITASQDVKIMDLGVARLADVALRLSQGGGFVGSLHYAAPELFDDGPAVSSSVDGRADLFALGVMLYELSSGEHPHAGDDMPHVLRRIREEKPRRLGGLNPQLSPFFEELVHTLLEKDPADRFASAAALASAIQEGTSSEWWQGRASALQHATRRPLRRVRIPRETALYGRNHELDRLDELYERAAAGEGHVAWIEGEAGIGKTRLLDEFAERLAVRGAEASVLYGSFPPGGAATGTGAFAAAFHDHLGVSGSAPYLRDAPLLVPAFDALLRGEGPPPDVDPLTHGAIHAAFSHVARALAAERPVVLALEDLHLAPAGGLVLFAALARLVPDHRILLIGTACPGLPDAWRTPLVDAEATTCLPLSRLGPRDLAALLENAFQSERLAHELGVGIGEKSDGNPFFVFEIIRGLRDGLFLQQREDGTWTTTGAIDDIQVPASVRDLVNARVAGLEEAERDLLDMASVAGFRFDPLVIAEAMGEPPMRVLKQLAQIERGHRLVRAAGATYVFDHQQIHEALYTSLSGPLRATYHDALGGALTALAVDEPVAICEHFLRGGSDEKADVHLDAALDRLDRRHRAEEVSDLISRVLSHVGVSDAARRGGLLLRRAEALAHLGRREEQRASLEEAAQALEGLAESELHVRVANANARLCWMTGGLVEAQAHLDRAQDLARRVRDASGELESLGARGLVLLALGRYDDAGDAIEEALAFAEALGDAAGIARAQANLGVLALRRGRYEEALERLERHLSLVRDAQDRTMEGKTLSNLATVHRILGRYEEARALCAQHLELAQGIGDRHGEGTALWGLGVVAFARGRYDEAQQLYERRQSLSREIGDALGVAMCSAELGNVAVVQGRYADARGFLEASLAQATAMGSTSLGVAALASLGILDYYEGRFADARMRQEKTLALMREMGDRGREAGVIGTLGSIDHAEGRLRDALERQSRRRALSKDAGDRTGEALGCVGLGAVLRDLGRTREARELHVEALALAREAGNAREEAQALFELGLDARQEGNLPRARARLDAARTAYRALGDQAQVDALLAIADLALSQEEWDEATRVLADASEMACTVENPAAVVTMAGLRALLPEGDVAAARGALEAREARLAVGVRLRMRYLLWTADGRVQDLVEAKALLELLIENAPPEDRASLGENVPLCRDVAQAWKQDGAASGGGGAV